MTDFSDIRPYNDAEATIAMRRLARDPRAPFISKYFFRDLPASTLSKLLRSFETVDDFQQELMTAVGESIFKKTMTSLTWSGESYLNALGDKKFLTITNHRDITVDPLAIQYMQTVSGVQISELCVGSNLLFGKTAEDIMRSNKMICVKRGAGAREIYESSKKLSEYIRLQIASGSSSVWIAQKEGRAKDGIDRTEQGVLKMLDMSGKGTFEENFEQLCILPMVISYEYEPCDAFKAREVLLKRLGGTYVKKKNEDLNSILTGIKQKKGQVHIEICKPLSAKEIASAGRLSGNDRYQALINLIDRRIHIGYMLWKTNYMAHDMLYNDKRYIIEEKYSKADMDAFKAYVNRKVASVSKGLEPDELRKIFLGIYANPVDAK